MPIDSIDLKKTNVVDPFVLRKALDLIKMGTENVKEKKFLSNFFENIIGNIEFNKFISNFSDTNKNKDKSKYFQLKYQNYGYIFDGLRTFSYKSGALNDINVAKMKKKMDYCSEAISKGDKIPYKNRSTLREFGKLRSVVGAYNAYNNMALMINDKGGIDFGESTKLSQIMNLGKPAENFLKQATEEIDQYSVEYYKSGDIILSDIDQNALFYNKQLSTKDRVVKLVTKHGHAATIVNDQGSLRLMHIMDKYKVDNLTPEELLFSDVYRIELSKLLTEDAKKAAENKYGNKWEEKINDVYSKVHKEEFTKSENSGKYYSIENSGSKMNKIGLKSFMPWGNTKFFQYDWNRMRDKFERETENREEKMVCSEFASRLAIVSIMKSNEKLQKDLGIESNTLNIPFSQKEDLNAVYPDRLVKILKKAKCVTQIPAIKQLQFVKRPEEIFEKIVLGIAKDLKEGISKKLSSKNVCNDIIDSLVSRHNNSFPNDRIELDDNNKKELVNLILPKVKFVKNKIIKIRDDTSILVPAAEMTQIAYNHIENKIDSAIVKDIVSIANKLLNEIEIYGKWVDRAESTKKHEKSFVKMEEYKKNNDEGHSI